MATERGPIYFLTGAPGVGKSTAGRALAERYEKAIFFDVDYFRQLVIKGRAYPKKEWNDEITNQISLAHTAVAHAAKVYAEAGFAVVVDHCSSPENIRMLIEIAGPTRVACLRAEMQENLKRNRDRTNKSFDTLEIEHFVESLGDSMHRSHSAAGFAVIDSTDLTVEQTVDRIIVLPESL